MKLVFLDSKTLHSLLSASIRSLYNILTMTF